MGYIKEKTGWDIGDPIMSLGTVAEKAISDAVNAIGKTVEGILKDPLPTLLQIGGSMVGIPPYVTAAVITAARGGSLEDVAKSAAVSYASSSFMSDTQIGADIKNYTTNQWSGDFTDSMMEQFNLSPDQAIQVSKIASSSLNSALVGGINAVISGKPVMDSISSGFTSGLIYSSTNSYFDELSKNPNWGFSSKTLDLMKGASSSALNSIVSGKGDPAQAVGNYITSAYLSMGETALKKAATEAYANLTTDTDAAKAAQDKYITAKAELDDKARKGEALRKEINDDSAAYQSTIINQYNPFKASYDKLSADSAAAVKTYNDQKAVYESNMSSYNNYQNIVGQYGGHYESRSSRESDYEVFISHAPSRQSFLDAANAAAGAANAAARNAENIQASAQKLIADNQSMIDGLTNGKALIDKKVADFQAIKKDIEDPSVAGSTAATLKAASDAYQTKYDAWSKTKSAADRSAENYTKALAEVATRDATIDALNTGAIKVSSKDADNNWVLDNGMTLTAQGKFMQNGQQVFAGAVGVPQKAMDFKANDGSNVDFNSEAGRVLSETDVVNICKRDYGFEPTTDEIDRLAGTAYTATGNPEITELADQKATAAYRSVTGTDPTADELAAIKKTRNVVGSAISLAKTGDADPWGNLEGAMLKSAEGDQVKFTDAQLTDMVRKGLVFEGGDFNTKQDAANAARLAGYTQFEYDNDVYTMQPGGPTEKVVFQAAIDMQPNKKEAFRKARELLGADKDFDYKGAAFTTAFWKPIPQPNAEIIGDGSVNTSRAGTRVGLPITSVEGLSYLTDQEKSVNQRIKEAYTGSTLSKIIGTPDDAMRTLMTMKDVALTPGQGVVNGIKGISDFYGIITGNINNPLSQSMQGVLNNFDELTSDKTKNTLKTIQSLVNEAAKDGQGSAAWETLKQAVLNPETALMTVGNALGSFFPALAASAPLVAAGVPAAAATGVFIALNAASQGGSSGQEALEFVARQLMEDPTVSMEYALEATIMAGRKAGIPAAAISAVINSMPMGRALEGALLKVSKSSLGKGVGSEILTEIPDETLAKIFSNYASGQDLSTGLGQTAVNAAIGAAGSAGAVHVKSDSEKLTDKVNDLVKSGEVTPAKIADLKNEVSNLIGNVGYGVEPTLDLMSDQFFSGIISQEVARELSLSGLSPEQIAKNLPGAVAHVESGKKIDPTYVDPFLTDEAEARQIAQSLGYTNPSPEVLKSLTGPISEADAQVKLDKFLGGMTAFESGKPIDAAAAQGMVKDLGLTNLSDAEAISLATKIVQSVPADKLSEPKMTPEQVRTIIDEFIVANPTLTEVQVGRIVNDAIAKIPAGTSAADISSLVKTAISNIPRGLSIDDVSKVVTDATKNLTTKLDTEKAISDAIGKISLPAGITSADVTAAIKTYMTENPGLSLADVAGKITESTKGLATNTSVQNAISTALKDVATTADVNKAISNIKFPAGITVADVANQIKAELAANPGLTANDVAKSIATYMTANPGLSAADVKAVIDDSTKNFATKKNIEDAIAGIKFPAGITSADVTLAITNYMKENPGLTLKEVSNAITTGTSGLATDAGVKTSISDALKGVATKTDVTNAIKGIVFPAGISKDDVTNSIAAYMKANPGLSLADVSSKITEATKGLVTSEGMKTAISDGLKNVATSAEVKTLESKLSGEISAAVAAGLTGDAAIQKGLDTLSAKVGANQTDLLAQLGKTTTDLKAQFSTQLGVVQTALAASEKSILAEVAKNESAGMTRDAALQAAINTVAATQKTDVATLKSQIAGSQTALGKEVSTQVASLQTKLSAEISAAVASGLSGDAALQKGLDSLSAKMGTNQTDLLNQLGTTTAAVKTDFATKLSGLDVKLTQAIADAKASGLAGDAALQAAINKVAADQKTDSATLLKSLGTTEASLKTQFAAQIGGVQADLAKTKTDILAEVTKNEAAGLTRDQALQKAISTVAATQQTDSNALLAKLGTTEAALKTQFSAQVGGLDTKLSAAIADAKAAGLQGDAALQSAINKVALDQKTTAEGILSQMGKSTVELKNQFASEIAGVSKDVQAKYDLLNQGQKDIVATQVKLGVDVNKAIEDAAKTTSGQIAGVKTELKKDIGEAQTQFNTRVDDLVKQGDTYQTATQKVLDEIKASQAAEKVAAEAAAKTSRAATAQAGIAKNLQQAAARVAPAPGLVDTSTPGFADIGLKTTGEAKFEGPLEQYMKMLAGNSYAAKPQETQQPQQVAPVQDELSAQQQQPGSDYFAYGQQTDIDLAQGPGTDMLYSKAGGLATPLFAGGGTTRHGRYAGGGLNVVEHSGKARIDFRSGNAVTGPGDGQSDDIPAMLADGEFVFPADVVAALGNGSTKAGSDKLYDMMHSIRAYHRSAKPRDLPPPAKKSPLDYLKKRKVRR
jgi:polyhydroxyalkanoate synthesis regulator phasin